MIVDELWKKIKARFKTETVYFCFFCNKESAENYQGICPTCRDMNHRAWERRIEKLTEQDVRQKKIESLIERIPELIDLLEVA